MKKTSKAPKSSGLIHQSFPAQGTPMPVENPASPSLPHNGTQLPPIMQPGAGMLSPYMDD